MSDLSARDAPLTAGARAHGARLLACVLIPLAAGSAFAQPTPADEGAEDGGADDPCPGRRRPLLPPGSDWTPGPCLGPPTELPAPTLSPPPLLPAPAPEVERPRPAAPVASQRPVIGPAATAEARPPQAFDGVAIRFGPTATANASLFASRTSGDRGGFVGWSARAGLRYAVTPRLDAAVSVTPTASALLVVESLGAPGVVGVGLATRFGFGVVKQTSLFMPVMDLYALAGITFGPVGGAVPLLLRFGVGVQLNLYAALTKEFGLDNALQGLLFGMVRGLGGGGGMGLWSGWGAIIMVAYVVLFPAIVVAGVVGMLLGMALNLEVTFTPPFDRGRGLITELRVGVGF